MLGFKTSGTLFRLLALFSCLVALVSTSLCLFAGIKHTKLDDIDMLTVRTCFLTSSQAFLTSVGEHINVATHALQHDKPFFQSESKQNGPYTETTDL